LVKKGQKPNFTWPFSKVKKIKGVEKAQNCKFVLKKAKLATLPVNREQRFL